MITRPANWNAFEFAVIASLRAQQLLAGCIPRVSGEHSASTMAQMEVADGRVGRANNPDVVEPRQCGWQL